MTRAADDQPAADDALFADNEVPVALVGTSYSANPNWNFVGALKEALRSDVVSYAEDGHGPVLPMLSYLKSDAFKNSPPQVLIWEFPNDICRSITISATPTRSGSQSSNKPAPANRT